jgi:hypothetical protein
VIVVGFAFLGCTSPKTPVDAGLLTGSVMYRERVALPPDGVVEVKLLDVSRQEVFTRDGSRMSGCAIEGRKSAVSSPIKSD